MREMIRRKTPEERLRMGCSMFDFSKSLVVNAILRERPNLSPAELRGELFLRFYGNDFAPARREKILAHLAGGVTGGAGRRVTDEHLGRRARARRGSRPRVGGPAGRAGHPGELSRGPRGPKEDAALRMGWARPRPWRVRDRLVVSGRHLEGATATLASSGGAAEAVALSHCGASTDTRLELALPRDIDPGTYTLTVRNQAGACDSTVWLLQGESSENGTQSGRADEVRFRLAGIEGSPRR